MSYCRNIGSMYRMAALHILAAVIATSSSTLAQDADLPPTVTIKDNHITLALSEFGYLVEFGGEGDLYADGWGAAVRQNDRITQACQSAFLFDGNSNVQLERFDGKDHDSTASSRVVCGEAKKMGVRHQFRSAQGRKGCKGAYEVKVTIENRGSKDMDEVIYRRQTDFDIEGLENFYTFKGVTAKKPFKVLQASNDFSCSLEPGSACPTIEDVTLPVNNAGPFDQGSVFEISLGKLPKGKSLSFKMYYGYFDSPKSAKSCAKSSKINTFSLAKSETSKTTALFGFRKSLSIF